jgi:hypothetical protein
MGGVPIEGMSAAVVPTSRSGINVTGGILDVFQRYTGLPRSGDECDAQRVRSDFTGAVKRCSSCTASYHARGLGRFDRRPVLMTNNGPVVRPAR